MYKHKSLISYILKQLKKINKPIAKLNEIYYNHHRFRTILKFIRLQLLVRSIYNEKYREAKGATFK